MAEIYPINSMAELIYVFGLYAWVLLKWIFNNIGTLGMFILTFFYVVYTKRMMIATNESVEISNKNLKEVKKPEMVAYFNEGRGNILNFILRNNGNSPAINVKTNLELVRGNLKGNFLKDTYFLHNPVTTIAPNQELITFVDMFFNILDDDRLFPCFEVEITYSDKQGENYTDSYTLDLNMYKGTRRVNDKGLHAIATELEKIRREME
ncbi:hypothetical protein [Rossellomorea sp. DA94]|uniref:hypothetical protein n=1 Tax=Rossellomorea sp. DA94 TaxID=3038653 RepID=UPI00244AD3D2|nr:hypothetical protein [Rossellomorea sp. DA94]WGG47658.1 hypothetical protein P8596_10810 [Rossellomorea sp. DA94]